MLNSKVVLFDLDDTLYNEIEYLKSAFVEISRFISSKSLEIIHESNVYNELWVSYTNKKDVFRDIIELYNLKDVSKEDLIQLYRRHYPSIKLSSENKWLLQELNNRSYSLGLITDGRSIQQRNKIKALDIEKYFKYILISEEFGSEKPHIDNFEFFVQYFGDAEFYYVGDNLNKDFIAPNKLGWNTICLLDRGENIHKQNFDLETCYLPKFQIHSLDEILSYL